MAALSGGLTWLWILNPAAVLAEGYRQALLFGRLPDIRALLLFWIETNLLNLAGILYMRRLRPTLADRL